ncbi:MAG: class I SAM-dependent methyltransferase [Lachnospiraceae bacterium]|nr:class I SAM-dependent methyltransferase [Lachnospiraceae bacterium]
MSLTDHFILHYLQQFDAYPFTITIHNEIHQIGEGEPRFHVTLKKIPDKKELMESTSLALGEAYMKGDLLIEGDLYETLDLFLSQIGLFTKDQHALKKLLFPSKSKKHQLEEISHHYDIGNDFYSKWLDDTMSYSCAYFKSDQDTLGMAQRQKVDYILKKLYLKKDMTLLDIGCGWGFLLLQAAKQYDVKGVGITLSKEQLKKFEAAIKTEGLEGRVSAKLLDYRDIRSLNQQFDRIVSVGMLEHVGRENYEEFFKSLNSVLKDDGLCLLHYISACEEHSGDPFLKKYIFPGGVIPSLREIISLCGTFHYSVLDVENLRRHYQKTLLCWIDGFLAHKEEFEQTYGKEFVRMWDLYLTSCAAAFHNGIVELHQILLAKKPTDLLPMTRWY